MADYICINCGCIIHSLKCPLCGYNASKDEYNKILDKARKAIRYGYYYRKEFEKNPNVYHNLITPTNYLEWLASVVILEFTSEAIKYTGSKICNYIKSKIASTNKNVKNIEAEILDILSDEDKLIDFINYIKEYDKGLPSLSNEEKAYINEEEKANFIGEKAGELCKNGKVKLTHEDFVFIYKEWEKEKINRVC